MLKSLSSNSTPKLCLCVWHLRATARWTQRPSIPRIPSWAELDCQKVRRASAMAQQQRVCLQCRRHRRCGLGSWVGEIPWGGRCQATPGERQPVGFPGRPQGQRSLRVGVRGVTRRSWSQHTCQEVTKLNHINSILQRHVYHYWVKNLRLHSYLSYVEEINKSTSYAWRSCTFCYLKSLHKDCIKMFSEDSLLRKCSSWKLGSCPLSDKETIQFNIFLFLCPNYLTILN